MIFRRYSEFLQDQRLDESVKMAKAYLGMTQPLPGVEKKIAELNQEIRKLTKDSKFEDATKAKAERDRLSAGIEKLKVFEKIAEMLKARPQWTYVFTKFYFEQFAEEQTPEQRMEELKQLLASLNELDKKHLLGELAMVKANPGAGLNQYADVVPGEQDMRKGMERLSDDIRDAGIGLIINKFISQLPGRFVVTNPGKSDVGTTVPSFKDAARNATGRIKDQIRELAIAFEDLGDDRLSPGAREKQKNALHKVFFWGCKRYRTINEIIAHAYEYVKSCGVSDVASLREKIYEANDKYGFINGAEIVYDQDMLVIFEVKSYQSNVLINAKTKHCIKDSYGHWSGYGMGDEGFNKQYYVWNFNVNPANSEHIIGMTVEPGGRVRAAHMKMDEAVSDIKKYFRNKYGLKFDEICLPMTPTEVELKKKRVAANRILAKQGLTRSQAEAALQDGGDPNTQNGKPLENAVKDDDYEMVEFLIKSGAKPTIAQTNPMEHAKSLKVISILLNNGVTMTENVINNCIKDVDAVKFLLENGLDPNSPYDDDRGPMAAPVRAAIRSGAVESLKVLLQAGGEVYPRRFLSLRQAFEYGHVDIVKLLIDHIKAKGLTLNAENKREILEKVTDSLKVQGNKAQKEALKKKLLAIADGELMEIME